MTLPTSVGPPEPPPMSATLRRWIIERSLAARVGHVGSALSIVEILAVLWGRVLRSPASGLPDRDRFVLAKGHAALALYAALRWKGLIDDETFHSYCRDGSPLGVHPERGVPGVEVGTGSLGQGLSVGCGIAHARKRRGSPARVFVLLSDAECDEGQVWEAAMFAAHHRLDNLVAVVDDNGMQAFGRKGLVLESHDDYFQGKPGLKQVVRLAYPNEQSALAALKSGELDITGLREAGNVTAAEQDENITVLSGWIGFGLGRTFDKSKGRELPAGSYFYLPANTPHFAWTGPEGCVMQIHGTGPFP